MSKQGLITFCTPKSCSKKIKKRNAHGCFFAITVPGVALAKKTTAEILYF